ncbi:MAG: NUDIX domain-containing protein [Planctomycetota bacterium]
MSAPTPQPFSDDDRVADGPFGGHEFGVRERGRYTPRPSAYVIVVDARNRIATVHTPGGMFLPGGGLQSNESASEAAVREAWEEAALVVAIQTQLCRASQLVFAADLGAHIDKRSTFFVATLERADSSGGERDHRLHWLPPAAAATSMKHESHAWAIEQLPR